MERVEMGLIFVRAQKQAALDMLSLGFQMKEVGLMNGACLPRIKPEIIAYFRSKLPGYAASKGTYLSVVTL